jgi:hypothetical protein
MKKIDKFKWTAVAAISTIVLATIVLAFVAPIYLITLWLGFCVGYVEVRALTLYPKELQNEKNILATDPEVKVEAEKIAVPSEVRTDEVEPNTKESNKLKASAKTKKMIVRKKIK